MKPGHLPGRFRIGCGENLEAPRGVTGNKPALGGLHRGVTRAQSLTAPLARAVPGIKRIKALHRRLYGAGGFIQKAVTDRKSPRLIKTNFCFLHDCRLPLKAAALRRTLFHHDGVAHERLGQGPRFTGRLFARELAVYEFHVQIHET